MRTGNGRASNNPLFGDVGSPAPSQKSYFADYLPWGQPRAEKESSSFVSWPSWSRSAPEGTSAYFETLGLTMMQRYAAFGICICLAGILLFVAFLHLTFAMLSPAKFAVPFCLCTFFLVVSFGFLHGFVSYAKHLFSPTRWAYSAALVGSTVFTLWAALGIKRYVLILIGTVFQMAAMVAYFVSYIPGGPTGLSMFSAMLTGSVKSQFTSI